MTAPEVIATLRSGRFLFSNERDLQDGIGESLATAGAHVQREVLLNQRDRIDFLVDRVGVEVKFAGAWRDVERQLRRYLESDWLDELVLVTTKAVHRRIPQGDVGGKRLYVHQITTSGL